MQSKACLEGSFQSPRHLTIVITALVAVIHRRAGVVSMRAQCARLQNCER